MMKKIIVVFIASLFIISCSQNTHEASTQNSIDRIKEAKVLKVGTSGEQFPFSFKNAKGDIDGLDIEIAKVLAKRMNVEVEFVVTPFEQLIPTLKEGKTDIILSGMSVTVPRNMEVSFSTYYFKTGKAILSNKSEITKGKDEDINQKDVRIAVLDKSSSLDFVQVEFPNVTVVTVNSYDEISKLFKNEEIDAFVSDIEICESISIKNLDINLNIKELKGVPEYISAAVLGDDELFLNLVSNFMFKVKNYNTEVKMDNLWLEYLN